MYVYVDEHGVEHEISAEEAAQYEVVDQVEHVVEDEDPQPDPEPEPTHHRRPRTTTSRRRYFWVDEHGVEHEVTEDELHEFELYDEDES